MSQWQQTAIELSELSTVFTDGDWIEKKDQSLDGIRLIQTGNVGTGQFKNRQDKARFISSQTFEKLKCTEIVSGDCLISRLPDPVGRACLIPEDLNERMITAVDCSIVRFNKDLIIPKFFIYYSQSRSYLATVEKFCTGATRKRISRKNLGKIKIPRTSLFDQERIVSVLDEAFEAIDTAIANTEKNLLNTEELFQSILDQQFNDLDSDESEWQQTTIGELCEVISGQSPKGEYYNDVGEGLPFYQGKKEFQSRHIGAPKKWTTHITKEALPNDVLMSVRAPVGPVNFATEKICIGRGLAAIRAGEKLNSDFLFYGLLAKQNVITGKDGAVFKSINREQINLIEVPALPLSEQERIVSVLDEANDSVQALRDGLLVKLAGLEELKQSVLEKAFSGELTDSVLEEAGV